MALDNLLANRQTDARAGILPFSGESLKNLKDALCILIEDAYTVILKHAYTLITRLPSRLIDPSSQQNKLH